MLQLLLGWEYCMYMCRCGVHGHIFLGSISCGRITALCGRWEYMC